MDFKCHKANVTFEGFRPCRCSTKCEPERFTRKVFQLRYRIMKPYKMLAGLAALQLLCAQGAFAAAKAYQVTGSVIEVTSSLIVVQKGDERFEIDRSPDTKVLGDIKVGQKVTVYYRMQATKVEVKDAKASTKEKTK